MFERLVSFLQGLGGGAEKGITEDDPRVAATALLLHVMDADGVRSEDEHSVLHQALSKRFGLQGSELDAILAAGEEAEREAVDLYGFTSVLMRQLDEEQRVRFIELMWQVVFADGEVHELEDNTVWRVAELMGVDSRTRTEARTRAGGKTPTLDAMAERDDS
ncbi:TerB family tellurite resistance protein [Tianweitania sp. BSSL-BM11]|uniref:TerB family tellurite resistance protein n=1 Tax=Tianweitania aestuarii TaxID=2814886 RepID=A0ABS5RX23_9HYPH|nr:TerB family tellurite resistance protein [Tianweitania aestuarii]MBS9721588.1 TerB family tellurite resistance protein [Tianweitania aestuarii]